MRARTAQTDGKAHSAVVGGSTAKLRRKCSASRIEEAKVPRETSIYADRGTALHHICEVAVNEGLDDQAVLEQFRGVAIRKDDMQFTIDITEDMIRRKVWPALAYSDQIVPPDGALYVEAKIGMQWAGAPSRQVDFREIPGAFGTGDQLFSDVDNGIHGVLDFKFGEGRIIRAEDNDQGRFYLVSAIMRGLLPVASEYEFHIFQPADKLQPSEFASVGVYTLEDLEAFNHDLHDAIMSDPVHTVGPHCEDCKGKIVCAAFREFVTSAQTAATDLAGVSLSELGKLYGMAKAIRAVSYQIEDAALRNARQGRVIEGYGLVPALGNSVFKDEDAADAALARKGVPAADRRISKLVSPAQALELLTAIGTPEKEIERFKATHIRRPDNGDKLAPLEPGQDASPGAAYAAALKKAGLA